MYNSKLMCQDKELTFLSFEQKINKTFTKNEVLSSHLWKVYDNDGVFKCVPLFNCDIIESTNPKDIVLEDNKCLIMQNKENTVINVFSDDTGGIHYYNIQLYAFTLYRKLDLIDEVAVYCIVYDEYLNTLNNIGVNVLVDGDVTAQIQTNSQGVCKYKINKPCNLSFEYMNNNSNILNIRGG